MTIKILLADDHKILREGLRTLIEKQPDMEVVGESENGRTAVKLAQKLKPDVVLMDITMSELNGIEATRQISSENRHVRILVLSMHSDRRLVVEILKAGASGYLLKEDCDSAELARAIRSTATNQIYLSPKIARFVVEDYLLHPSKTEAAASSFLTHREREVLQLIAEGKTTKQIASTLYLSVKTVETHRKHIMEKLDIYSLAGLIRYAIQQYVVSLDT